eukprot:SAG22_NODE_452_length_10341_cov_12.146065_10_plen_101_part_00
MLRRAADLMNAGGQRADPRDAKAHYEGALAMYDSVLARYPGCYDAQYGQRAATKGLSWDARAAQHRAGRVLKEADTRQRARKADKKHQRGAAFLGHHTYD